MDGWLILAALSPNHARRLKTVKLAARATEPLSGLTLTMSTTAPAVNFFTADNLGRTDMMGRSASQAGPGKDGIW